MEVSTRPITDGDYAFASDNPTIRSVLRQLDHAYNSALVAGQNKLASQIKAEALRLKVAQDIAIN
jgi:hypothetical protein